MHRRPIVDNLCIVCSIAGRTYVVISCMRNLRSKRLRGSMSDREKRTPCIGTTHSS